MSEFNTATEFDVNFVERPKSIDEMKRYLNKLMKDLEEIYKVDQYAFGLEVVKLKLLIGKVFIYFNEYDKAEENLLAAYEESKADKLALQLFESKMNLGALYYYQKRFYKCDEFLQKCITVANKNLAFKHYLPKLYLYLSLNKRVQKETSKQVSFAKLGLNSCIELGDLDTLEICKKLLTN